MARAVPWVQSIKAAPYFACAQFSEPGAVINLPDPGDEFPFVKAMWHYARGVTFAARGEPNAARSEAAAIRAINERTDFRSLVEGGVPAPDVLRLAHHVVNAHVAQAHQDHKTAIAEFNNAVAIQDTLPYTEPPHWYYPVRQSLGAALLAAGRTEEARQVFWESLVRVPNNGWAWYGLMESQKALGDRDAAAETEKRLDKA